MSKKLSIIWLIISIVIIAKVNLALGQELQFSYLDGSQCGSGIVSFEYFPNVSGDVVKLEWDFGNGSTVKSGAELTPSDNYLVNRSYNTHGEYNVTLRATHNGGIIRTYTKKVEIFEIPTVHINIVSQSGTCAPVTYTFEPVVTPASGTTISKFFWVFGDGKSKKETTDSQVTHTYNSPGTYNLTLEVTDSRGCQKTFVLNQPIVIGETFDLSINTNGNKVSCTAPQTINFEAIHDPGTYEYLWDFGDGNTSTLQNPSHSYASKGYFNVVLWVKNLTDGCERTITKNSLVKIKDFVADFRINGGVSCAPATIEFENRSNHISGTQTVTWDFGDGTVISGKANNNSFKKPKHTYASAGTFTVKMTVVDSGPDACTGPITKTDFVIIPELIGGDFTADKTSFCDLGNSTIIFTPNSIPAGVTSYEWNFGDGNTSALVNPTHTYTAFGSYDVTLTIRDGNGCSHTITKNSYINGGDIEADFEAVATGGCYPLFNVSLTDLSNSFVPITHWDWEVTHVQTSTVVATSNAQNPSLALVDHGDFNVKLTITTAEGCTDALTMNDYLHVGFEPDSWDFVANPTTICNGTPVNFTNNSTMPAAASNYDIFWDWDFTNDGTIDYLDVIPNDQSNTSNTYDNMDPQQVSVTLYSRNNGCVSQFTKPNYIIIEAPRAEFTYAMPTCLDDDITLSNISVGGDTFDWEITIGTDPPYTVTTNDVSIPVLLNVPPGTAWSVTLTATNTTSGCDHSISANDIFPSLTADFSTIIVNNATGGSCFPVTYQFDATAFAIYGTNITNYAWDFDNGTTGSGTNPTVTFNQPGSFDVTLEVTTSEGCTYSHSFPTIDLFGPQVDFTVNDYDACKDFEFEFTDITTSLSTIAKRTWDFGDGNSYTTTDSAETTFKHIYNAVNSPQSNYFKVTLTVEDDKGCSNTKTRNLRTSFPIPDFDIERTAACGGEYVKMINAKAKSDVLNEKSIKWTFSDGRTASGFSPNKLFFPGSNSGTDYSVTLELTDQNNCTNTLTKSFKVYTDELTANFKATSNTFGSCPPFTVSFEDLSTLVIPTGGLANSIVDWKWDFGDGTVLQDNNPTPAHTYLDTGNYNVTLEVFCANGCSETFTIDDMVTLAEPNATFTVNPKIGYPGQEFTYEAKPIPADAGYDGYIWDYGDGDLGFDQNATYQYATPGFYNIQLTVKEGDCKRAIPDVEQVEILSCPEITVTDIEACPSDGTVQVDVFEASHNITLGKIFYEWIDLDNTSVLSQTSKLAIPQPNNIASDVERNIGVKIWIEHSGQILCSQNQTFKITFKPNPIADFNTSPNCTQLNGGTFEAFIENASKAQGTGNSITLFEWDTDNDGTFTNANESNVTATFSTSGEHLISLRVEQSNGCTDTISKEIYIPEADFTFSDPCSGQPVQFTDKSTYKGTIFYSWDFDGDSIEDATSSNPVFVYQDPGNYNATLSIRVELPSGGLSCAVQKTKTITVNPTPVLDLKAGTSCLGNETKFSANGSIFSGNIISYDWDFDQDGITDASTATGNTNHVFHTVGNHKVTVTATSDSSCTETASIDFIVAPVPVSNFTFENACENDSVTFNDISTIDDTVIDTEITLVEVDFDNDGKFEKSYAPNEEITFAFANAGTYTINYKVTSDFNCTDISSKEITIFPIPVPNFDIADVCDGKSVLVSDKTNNRGTAIATFAWDFESDGTIDAFGASAEKIYGSPGKYEVTLTVTNSEGCTASITKSVTVLENPVASFEHSPNCTQLGDSTFEISLKSTSSPQGEGNIITLIEWDHDDDNVFTHQGIDTPTFSFPSAGEKTISLRILQSNGCADTVSKEIYIPEANFTFSDPCSGQPVQFTDKSTYKGTVSYSWDFDGDSIEDATSSNPVFVYQDPGNYNATLSIRVELPSGGLSCAVQKTKTITVDPTPTMALENSMACLGTKTLLKANGKIASGSIEKYEWDINNDGVFDLTTQADSILQIFNTQGKHQVTVKATSDLGCEKSASIVFTVAPLPEANVIFQNACEGSTIEFTDASIIDQSAVSNELVSIELDFDNDGVFEESFSPDDVIEKEFLVAGNYPITYKVTTNYGCSDIITKQLVINPMPKVDFTVTDVCDGEIVHITESSRMADKNITSYEWDFESDGVVDAEGLSTENKYDTFGQYNVSLIITNRFGCQETFTKTVNVFEQPTIDAGKDAFICEGEFYDLKASSNFKIENWIWNNGEQTGKDYRVNPGQTTTYYLQATDANGCVATDSVTITVIEAPDIVSDTVACEGDVITFDGTINGDYFATYIWSTGESTPKIHITQAGTYTLNVHVSGFDDSGKECHFEHTVNVDYNVLPAPYPVDSIVFCFDNPYYDYRQDTLIEYKSDFKKIVWVEEAFPTDSVFSSEMLIEAPGVYFANITNKFNCTRTDSVKITELCPALIKFPNAFTPNGDNLNDAFRVRGENFIDYEMTIYNRWGEIIFQTKDQEQGWSGSSGGADLPMGVYPFMVVYEEELYPGQKRTIHGSVTLIR